MIMQWHILQNKSKKKKKKYSLGWEVFQLSLSSPDLLPRDFHMLRSLDKVMHGRAFRNKKEIENCVLVCFCEEKRERGLYVKS